MDIIKNLFHQKTVNVEKLKSYGFQEKNGLFVLEKTLQDSGFPLTITVTEQGIVTTKLMDPAFQDIYTLHLVDGAAGSFVGNIKSQYEEILTDISINCFEIDRFQTPLAKELIQYVKDQYGDTLEYLWKKFPNNAVWRRKDSGKWYAALLTVTKQKLGIDSEETVEIIDLRMDPAQLASLIDNHKYYPGYHMNKKHWYTVILDGSVSFSELCQRIDDSYHIAKK